MKATELMIGDWVLYMNVIPCEIVAIDSATCRIRKLFSDKVDEFGNKDYKVIYTRIEDIFPIPLTPKILEKNGFEDNVFDRWMNSRYDVALTEKDGFLFIWDRIQLDYVHELQHALGLCGLKELADNFKV